METDRKRRPPSTVFVSYAENLPNSPLRITGEVQQQSRILPPFKARNFLRPFNDTASEISESPRDPMRMRGRLKDRSTEDCKKEHNRYFRLNHTEGWTVAQHSVNQGYTLRTQ